MRSKKRKPWAVLAAIVAFVSTAAGLLSNIGGARDAVCKLASVQSSCRKLGLAEPSPPPPDPAKIVAAARIALLGKVPGIWGLPAKDGKPACVVTFSYSLARRGTDDFILLRGKGFESAGRVVIAEDGSIFTRTVAPAAQAGAQWELRLEGDRLIQVDANNISTTLVRCGR